MVETLLTDIVGGQSQRACRLATTRGRSLCRPRLRRHGLDGNDLRKTLIAALAFEPVNTFVDQLPTPRLQFRSDTARSRLDRYPPRYGCLLKPRTVSSMPLVK